MKRKKKRCCDCKAVKYIDNKKEKGVSDLLSGQISVTRAIGDYHKNEDNKFEKLNGLICDPHITKHELSADDEFMIIGCDGLCDVVDSKNALLECRRSLRKNGDVNEAAKKLINLAKTKSSALQTDDDGPPLTSDNISVLVIGFANKDKQTQQIHIGPKIEAPPPRPKGRRRFRGFTKKTSK